MATVIDRVSDDDQRQELLRYVIKVEGGEAKDTKKVEEEITALVADQAALFARALDARTLNAFLGVASETEAENSFNLLFTLLRKQPAATAEPQFAKLTDFLTSDTSAKQQLRLRILSNLYNFAPSRSASRLNAFVSLINYALATKAADVILPQLKKLRLRLQEWGATKDQIRQIYSTVRKVHQEVGNTPKAHKTALRILATYEGESAEALAKVAADAASVIVEAIKLPESFQFDHILELAAVKELASSADHGKLHRLLSIFTTENLAAYDKFVAENAGFIEAQGLSPADCRKKMQLLTLASLASEQRELPYSTVGAALQIQADEVEHWIISAIGAKLIDAKMDQLRQVAIVTRAQQRVFTTAQWKQLGASLQAWRVNLENVLKVIQASSVRTDKDAPAM